MLERYTKAELLLGVVFEDFTIQWREDLHRFTPIDFTDLPEGKFEKFEEDIYYLIIEGGNLDDCLLSYYDVQLEDDDTDTEIPYVEALQMRALNYEYQG